MPRFDFQCGVCGSIKRDVLIRSTPDGDEEMAAERKCECGAWREKMPAAPNFTVKGKFTEKNGYGSR